MGKKGRERREEVNKRGREPEKKVGEMEEGVKERGEKHTQQRN